MNSIESKKENYEKQTEKDLMLPNANDIIGVDKPRHQSKTQGVLRESPFAVSKEQFATVRMEQLTSLNLLNSSGNALLSAMQSMIPHEDSGRVVGEYTAKGIRQISKSICEIVMTKAYVVKQMYSIARDE